MRQLLILVNPFSGKRKGLEAVAFIRQKLSDKIWHFEVVVSEYKGHLTDFLKTKSVAEFDALIVVGGDGTMHEVVNGIAEKDYIPPIQLFPCGSGNSFNHDINCLDWETAIERLKARKLKEIDFFKLSSDKKSSESGGKNDFYGFNIAGWGLVADINQSSEKLRWLGSLRYIFGALIDIFKNPVFKGNVVVDDEVFEGNFCFVLACNTVHTGKAMKIAPLADLSDGLLDILIVKHLKVSQLLRLFPMIFSGKHISSSLLIYKKCKRFSIEAEPQTLTIDGEVKGDLPISVEVLDKKLTMIV